MVKQVTVNLYDVEWDQQRSQPLADTLQEFDRLPLAQRWRSDVRLERVSEIQTQNRQVFRLDFTKKREVGPGKLADATAITSIRMAINENFGEETAAFYVPTRNWLLILHNQAGIGPTRMMSYCNALDPGNANRHFSYVASPKLDATILRKLQTMRTYSKLSVKASVDALDQEGERFGMSLAEATRPAHARVISFELSANEAHRKGLSLDRGFVRSTINALRRMGDDVSRLQVTGESDEVAGKDMMIDLLQHKLKRKYRSDELIVNDHRYTLESRWDILQRAFIGWNSNL